MRTPHATIASRRSVLRGIACGLVGASVAPFARHAFGAEGGLTVTRVTPEISVIAGAGGNIVVRGTAAGQVVVDSGAAGSGAAVLGALRELGGGPNVALLVNTHWHLEQVGGNETLARAGATIAAHEKTRQRLTAGWYVPTEDRYEKPLPEAARPTKTFYTTDAAEVGGARVEFGYLIEAHTDGDVYVRFPDANVIAAGDVISPERDPALDWFGGGWLGGRVDALAKLLELGNADTRYIPSFGPVIGRAEVQAEHDLMLEIFERMVVHIRLGESADDILSAGVLNDLPRRFADRGKFLYDAHKSLWAHHNKLMHDIV